MFLQAVIKRYETAVNRVKDSRQRIAAKCHEMSLMSDKHQQLVNRISQLETAIEQKKTEFKEVPYLYN